MRPITTTSGVPVVRGEVAYRRETECEGNWHRREYHGADEKNEKDEQVEVAERFQNRSQEYNDGYNDCNESQCGHHAAHITDLREPEDGRGQHQSNAHRQRRGAPGVDDVESGRCDVHLVRSKLVSRVNDE